MFRMFFLYICTEPPMSEAKFNQITLKVGLCRLMIIMQKNEYSLSEFDIESDDIVRHQDHLYRCLVYACYVAPQLPVNSLNNLMTYHLSHP